MARGSSYPVVGITGNSSMSMRQTSEEKCFALLGQKIKLDTAVYCNATWDTLLCWAPAFPNTTALLPCPALAGLDTSKFAYRYCGPNGIWQGKEPGDYSTPQGYTFYGACYTEESKALMKKYRHMQHIKEITGNARTLEIVGLCVSLVSTILSLVIFCYFRSLRCHRTRIHKNLFVAIIVQTAMRILMCVDQYIARKTGGEVAGASSGSSGALYDTPVFCEIMYALLEYTKTVKFMWMFVEGLYLHNMIAVAFFSGKPNYLLYYALGWGVPVIVLTAWVVPMTQLFKVKCWFAYYYIPLIWILEGPRAAVMAVNLGFLLNIIRVLVMKLRETHTNEAKRVRKAVKAAIILLPLLGLTNFVIMLEPGGEDIVLFSVWIFSAQFLTDFEGFFISLIYCFLNGEVQSAVRRHFCRHLPPNYSMDLSTTHWRNTTIKVRSAVRHKVRQWRQRQLIHSSSFRRLSRSLSVFTSFTEVASNAPAPPRADAQVDAQRNNSQAVVLESNGTLQQELTNGCSSNGQATTQMPLLKFASRRMHSLRRGAPRDTATRASFHVTEPLKADQVEEQII